LEGVRQPGAVVIPRRGHENLRLVLEATKRLGVNDPVPIALKRCPQAAVGLRDLTLSGIGARGEGRELRLFTIANALGERLRHRSGRMLVKCGETMFVHLTDSDSAIRGTGPTVAKLSQSGPCSRRRGLATRASGAICSPHAHLDNSVGASEARPDVLAR